MTGRIGRLSGPRMREVCAALAVAVYCNDRRPARDRTGVSECQIRRAMGLLVTEPRLCGVAAGRGRRLSPGSGSDAERDPRRAAYPSPQTSGRSTPRPLVIPMSANSDGADRSASWMVPPHPRRGGSRRDQSPPHGWLHRAGGAADHSTSASATADS
jgi:hypothetical protein